jgi:Zn-dependent peptidase ImmA (M78 family)
MHKVLQEKYSQLLNEEKLEHDHRKHVIGVFITYACEQLGINKPYPKIVLNNDPAFGSKNKTFGHFNVVENKIVVAGANRNLADVLRTIAHELTHYHQKESGTINDQNIDQSGETGSDIENEANARAGVIMRNFGKMHPEIYE